MPRFCPGPSQVWNSILAVLILASLGTVTAAAERPNVLFIAVDDLRPELACYGASHIHSPNIDRLAASGTTFQRAYCMQAVCSPSRTCVMTGLRPDSTKVYDLKTHFRTHVPQVVTVAQHFKNNGYHTVSMGKIYHGGFDDPPSWSEPARVAKGGGWYAAQENLDFVANRQAEGRKRGLQGVALSRFARAASIESADVPDNRYTDGAIADLALSTLQELQQKQEPFFLAVGFIRPHLPFTSPKKYWDLYDRSQIQPAANLFPPKNVPSYALTSWGEMRAYSDIPPQGDLSPEKALELRHGYYASVSFTDANVGKLLDKLQQLGLAENTIVVLWGDHGWKLGEHNSWCKHTNFEIDANSPLIIRAPGQKAPGSKTPALVEFVDIYPTLCDLAGLTLPSHLEGVSAAPLLNDPKLPWKSAAFSQYPRGAVMGYSMKTDRYRFTAWKNQKSGQILATELYDHQHDPAENENVAGDPANAKLVQQLTSQLQAGWRAARPK